MKSSRIAMVWLMALALVLAASQSHARYSDEWDALEDVMDRGAEHGRFWTQSWYAIYGTSALTSAYLASESGSSTERYNSRVRTVTSSLALIDHFMNPLPHGPAYRELRSLRHHNADDALALDDARRLVREVAITEQRRRAFSQRIGSIIVNTTAGLVIGIGDDRAEDGITTALVGMAVTEVKIRTEPQTASNARGRTIQIGDTNVDVYPQFAAAPGYIGFHMAF